MDVSGYLRQIANLPPQVVARKAIALAGRTAKGWTQLVQDFAVASYGSSAATINPSARIAISASDVPPLLAETLRRLAPEYLAHRFDLLGSGWTGPAYGFRARGFLGHCYSPSAPKAPDLAGNGLDAVVNRANLARSRDVWRLIARHDYAPIDWQLDWRSGYRWSSSRPSATLPIPVDRGADIKVPWELGRLQHLPQLAVCAILAREGRPGFDGFARYVAEISDQLADFIAANPPRFGVNWVGVMDVAIRAANMALTMALLSGAGLALPPAMSDTVARSLDDHAHHVVTHLEYSETGRSNHYLADLGGLIWANWILEGPQAATRLKFAISEILVEADRQFLADGGNYEGSTGYHRLSAEIVLFSLALVASLDRDTLDALDDAKPPAVKWRVAFPQGPLLRHTTAKGGGALVPDSLWRMLGKAGHLSKAVQGADDTIVQIGDTDSGRFFKLHPAMGPDAILTENHLDHRGFTQSVDALSGGGRQHARLEAIVVRRLVGDEPFGALNEPAVSPAAFGDMAMLMSDWKAAPETCRRVRRIPFGVAVDPESWTRSAFPDFGLYIYRSGDRLFSFRCSGAPPAEAPRGHRHDDNLGIEYRFTTEDRRDPGSFVYTPGIEQRNRYRAASAHDVPRVRGSGVAIVGDALFDLKERAYAQCLYARNDGVAGEMKGPFGRILRILQIAPDHLAVFDCVDNPAGLEDVSSAIPASRGYGCL